MNRSLIAVVSASFVAIALASPASADVDPVSDLAIVWAAPPECPSDRDVRRAIADLLLSADKVDKSPTPVPQFEAVVTRASAGYELNVRVISSTGREVKSLNGATCAMVADAFALIVAFAIDPNLPGVPHAPVPPPLEPVAPVSRAPAGPAAETPTPSAPLPLALGASVGTSVGALPFPSVGLGATAALGRRPRWELGFSYWPERSAELAVRAGQAVVGVRLLAARTSACLPFAGLAFEACAAIDAGSMQAAATGPVSNATTGRSWWVSPSAGVAVRIPLTGALGLRLRLDLAVPLFRPAFTIERSNGPADVWRPDPVVGFLTLGPEIDFSPRNGTAPAM
jgi:uncharacterized membrane protein YgdD (TMEM256/DUF423 family)